MTLRLILIRHAKSSWTDPLQDDHDRVLNARGQRSAVLIGDWLASRGYIPAEVVCSSAQRTQETWQRMAPAFPQPVPMRPEPQLYLASSTRMLATLRDCTDSPVLMLAHNPGIADFAARLVATPPDHPRFFDYPTCATLVVDFDADSWADVAPGTGEAVDFVIPRELE